MKAFIIASSSITELAAATAPAKPMISEATPFFLRVIDISVLTVLEYRHTLPPTGSLEAPTGAAAREVNTLRMYKAGVPLEGSTNT